MINILTHFLSSEFKVNKSENLYIHLIDEPPTFNDTDDGGDIDDDEGNDEGINEQFDY